MTPHSKEIDPFLSAAAGIGLALCREAIWDASGRMCNWMGRSPNEITKLGGPVTPTAAALGPDLYGGSLGVAWVLAQLRTKTGEIKITAYSADKIQFDSQICILAVSEDLLQGFQPDPIDAISRQSGIDQSTVRERIAAAGTVDPATVADLAASIELAICNALVQRTARAVRWFRRHHPEGECLVAAGGVALSGSART